jgi:hypothetical protein
MTNDSNYSFPLRSLNAVRLSLILARALFLQTGRLADEYIGKI